ncbi:MAG: class I SAM-dependent methyltransferase [Betaproteobacteria bacterium]|nr:class I SAM-dependent methyltransferase [Betaproteobacteria bacterium]
MTMLNFPAIPAIPAVRALAITAWATLAALAGTSAHAQGSFGPYVPTPTVIVDRLLAFAEIRKDDYLIDLGSGDGRIVITAAKRYGASGHGIDIQEKLVSLANENALAAGVGDRVRFQQGDLFEADLGRASVITLYLLPSTITRLVPKLLAELKPGSRVVSHDYPLKPWPHERHTQFDLEEKRNISGTTLTVLYYYVVPAQVQGTWELRLPQATESAAASTTALRLAIEQTPERVTARAGAGNETTLLRNFSVKGEVVSFTLQRTGGAALSLTGKVDADVMGGSLVTPSGLQSWTARRLRADGK